jgi:hypothetical protein
MEGDMEPTGLSKKSQVILAAIADGHTYEQILTNYPAWTYKDIFQAAAEALNLSAVAGPNYAERLETIRRDNPRAYEKWTDEEDAQLRQLFQTLTPQKEIARILQRQPSAIRSRLVKLNLVAVQQPTPDAAMQPD